MKLERIPWAEAAEGSRLPCLLYLTLGVPSVWICFGLLPAALSTTLNKIYFQM